MHQLQNVAFNCKGVAIKICVMPNKRIALITKSLVRK